MYVVYLRCLCIIGCIVFFTGLDVAGGGVCGRPVVESRQRRSVPQRSESILTTFSSSTESTPSADVVPIGGGIAFTVVPKKRLSAAGTESAQVAQPAESAAARAKRQKELERDWALCLAAGAIAINSDPEWGHTLSCAWGECLSPISHRKRFGEACMLFVDTRKDWLQQELERRGRDFSGADASCVPAEVRSDTSPQRCMPLLIFPCVEGFAAAEELTTHFCTSPFVSGIRDRMIRAEILECYKQRLTGFFRAADSIALDRPLMLNVEGDAAECVCRFQALGCVLFHAVDSITSVVAVIPRIEVFLVRVQDGGRPLTRQVKRTCSLPGGIPEEEDDYSIE